MTPRFSGVGERRVTSQAAHPPLNLGPFDIERLRSFPLRGLFDSLRHSTSRAPELSRNNIRVILNKRQKTHTYLNVCQNVCQLLDLTHGGNLPLLRADRKWRISGRKMARPERFERPTLRFVVWYPCLYVDLKSTWAPYFVNYDATKTIFALTDCKFWLTSAIFRLEKMCVRCMSDVCQRKLSETQRREGDE